MQESGSSKTLEFTGERFTPECVREIWYEHWHRYAFAANFVAGKRVLDAACGEGYGSAMLAKHADSVYGIDVSATTVAHAQERYAAQKNLKFSHADCCDTGLAVGSFDVIVSFETIEHLIEHDALLAEFSRLLKKDGLLILSSPDKRVYSELSGFENPHHLRELYKEELLSLLAGTFPAVRLFGQKLMFNSLIWDSGSDAKTWQANVADQSNNVATALNPSDDPVYWIALCANSESLLPPESKGLLSLFCDVNESVYAHYNHEIRKNIQAGHRIQQLELELESIRKSTDAEPAKELHKNSFWQKIFGQPRSDK